ncbi:MAG TPA: zf-HC2 domain-containing protein [Micromonosporaceae bacterium]
MTCRFAQDDAAYVLGALTPAERVEFERHRATCDECNQAVAKLAVLPGLLSRLDPATAVKIGAIGEDAGGGDPAGARDRILARTLAAASRQRRGERRRRRWLALAAGFAALALATAVGLGVRASVQPAPPTALPTAAPTTPPNVAPTAMRPVRGWSPVSAEFGLIAVGGGSEVRMTCRYASGYDGAWVIRLVVVSTSGRETEQVGSWTATAGEVYSITARTHLAPSDVGRVELRRADGTPVLTWSRA